MTDAERERAVRELTRHCGDGRLTLDELEDRITQVYAASTPAELALAFRELPPFRLEPAAPVRPAAAAPVPATHPARRARSAAAARCGAGRMGGPSVILIVLITLLFVTSHIFLGVVLLVFALPKSVHRTYARA